MTDLITPADVLQYIRRVEHTLHKIREPIEVAPFLAWCDEREQQIRRETDHYPAISGSRDGGIQARHPTNMDPRGRLIMQLGWDPDNGQRRLHRWRHEGVGLAERSTVEEALFHADADMYDIYPELRPAPWAYGTRSNDQRYMIDKQVVAAHTVYVRAKMTAEQLGEFIWQRYGYKDAICAARALHHAWRRLGLPVRTCAGIRAGGGRCERWPLSGTDFCVQHDEDAKPNPAWQPPAEILDEARALHEAGMSFRRIGFELADRVAWKHPVYVGTQLAKIAKAQGWYYAHRTAA